MPTPEGIRRFLSKRGIPVRSVIPQTDGFLVIVSGKGQEVADIWGQTADDAELTIEEIPESNLRLRWWRLKRTIGEFWCGLKERFVSS